MLRDLILTGSPLEVADLAGRTDALFLGPWCFAARTDVRFDDQRNFSLAPPPWNWQDVERESEYIAELAARIGEALFQSLCRARPDLCRGRMDLMRALATRHFRAWLILWLGVCRERFVRLDRLQTTYPGARFRVRALLETEYVEKDLTSYFSNQVGPEYNLLLFSDLIRCMGARWPHLQAVPLATQWHARPLSVDPDESTQPEDVRAAGDATHEAPSRLRPPGRTLNALLSKLRRAAGALLRLPGLSVRAELHGGELSLAARLRLQLSLAPAHFLRPVRLPPNSALGVTRADWEQWPAHFQAKNDFETSVTHLLFRYMPPDYFELYLQTRRRFKLKDAVLLGADAYTPRSADLISEIRAAGGRVYTDQHGGGYGQYRAFANEDIERYAVDGFITWGWSDARGPAIALPSPYLSRLPTPAEREAKILLVGTMLPPALYKLQSALAPEQLLSYIQDKAVFVRALNPTLRAAVEYRGARLDFGVREREQAAEFLPAAQISDAGRLTNRIRDCRLSVFDHMSTSFLEALTMNAPAVLYWRPEYYGLNATVAAALDRLEQVGVYHRDPASAAARVMQVWDHAADWWSAAELQEARRDFCALYAQRDNRWMARWRRCPALKKTRGPAADSGA